jgi:CRP-like cAMP-binding protein
MLTTLEKVDLLQHVYIFKDIPTESLLRIAAIAQEVQFESRQVLFSEHASSDVMFVLLKGEISLTTAGQKERRLASYETAGDLTLLAGHPQKETASTRESTTVLRIGREDLYEAMAEDIYITRGILRALVELITLD